ncbi:chromosome segregation protein SMC [Companilactobacillus sp.]|jgi:chromosome segregation protein|uniref:chromosome segregation protein SMC n=1 Tax=Companilactobacillus sp. TaxID=2767905 RepID=UPI0025BAC293|nr:chromosome segregation protein SMC [Companilactobacillus sp.]MCH4008050.1 chromosome segregation protein SMC [Companilactobacillus sp.]MCH4051771.1 chromosome segregation protein SMC [Companilactobacillus sp.]MCH4075993.1 chromosome segregation protein SMC [Companilactobacillus sp.]MCH4124568.1 chromosome segregation protein SMC [Companilactobacillus sp.]MCH4132469.1 chromosome segregation protein SMC [Companilactobacillus sp.]
MPLKSLTINGFKSFADKTKIDFTTGITGIVGPNGSGKSNITEAIRWVMGEQSARSLRGDKMVDVIFAGSDTRPQMNRAEVTMEFDNSNHELKSSQENVTIRRKLFRNGDSEFSINNHNCRLKDINEIFMDSGMGKQSFSIISQGRVEEIFNSKPVERRSIIEESAGVALFKQKKQQAESKLSDTTDNLHRVSDIVSELAQRVEPLKKQASIARDYREQKGKYDELYQQILALEIKDLSAQKKSVQTEIDQVKTSLRNIGNQVKKSNLQVNQNRNAVHEIVSKIDQKQNDLVNHTRRLEQLNGQIAVSDERNGFNASNKDSISQRINDLATDKQGKLDQLKQVQEKISEYQADIDKYSKQLHDIKQLQDKTPEQLNESIAAARDNYVNALQQQVSNSNEQKFSNKQLTRIASASADQEKRLAEVVKFLNDANSKINQVKDQLKKLDNDNQELVDKSHKIEHSINSVTEQGQKENSEYLKLLESLQETKARKNVLENMEHEHAGFYDGAKNVLNNAKEIGGIVGAVAELIDVPQDYQLAIETIASNQLQSIVTENEQAAKKGINYLRQKRGGRATFLPLNIIKARNIYSTDLNNAKKIDGFIGIASDLISYKSDVENIIKSIFGNVLVAHDINAATRVSAAVGRKYRVVTIDGNVVNAGGSMTGGQQRRFNTSILTRKEELDKLTEKLQQQESLSDQKQQNVQHLRNQLVQLREENKSIEEELKTYNDSRNQLSNQLSSHQNEQKHLQDQQNALQYNQKRTQEERSEIESDLQKQVDKSKTLKQSISDLQADIEHKQEVLNDFDAELEKTNAQAQEVQTKLVVVKSNFTNESAQVKRLKSEINEITDQSAALQKRLDELNSERMQLDTNNSEIKQDVSKLESEIEIVKTDLQKLQTQRTEKDEESKRLNQEAERNFDLQKSASDQQENLAIQLTKLSNNMNSRLDTLEQDYQITYEAAIKEIQTDEIDTDKLRHDAHLLKMGIQELGTVNEAAIEEYDSVKDRYEFLTTQQNDLIKARKQLLDTMAEMDHEVVTRFKKTFDDVSAAFEVIFPEMFAGGRAKLVLTEPNDLLETGIEIIAQPPGKKFQRLSLLSGGEKALTAITLLFAIIKVNPVPFCILDEVEASLDDANVYRFANYLNRYDDNTEFIVITHRKGTMMNVNRLYGVTMEESGVSRILSVSVKD